MYIFYVDESGTLDPEISKISINGTSIQKDWIYSLTAFGLFEHKWQRFYNPIVKKKRQLIELIEQRESYRLELSQCEVKSTWLRIPKERKKHPFLSRLTEGELHELVESYYHSVDELPIRCFSVVIDKRYLQSFMNRQKLHRKAWELLCERIENFMREFHPKHKAILVADDISRQDNQSLAMKHAFFLEHGTSSGLTFNNIIETPFFVRSELSEGVQLADLCSYNVYRAFKYQNPDYPFFKRLLPKFYSSQNTHDGKLDGIKVFPPESPLIDVLQKKTP